MWKVGRFEALFEDDSPHAGVHLHEHARDGIELLCNDRFHFKVVPGGKKPVRACKETVMSQSDSPPATASDEKAPSARDGASRIDTLASSWLRQRQRRDAGWDSLLKRIFKLDVLNCGRCGGRMKVLAIIEDQPVIEKMLRHLGLPRERGARLAWPAIVRGSCTLQA